MRGKTATCGSSELQDLAMRALGGEEVAFDGLYRKLKGPLAGYFLRRHPSAGPGAAEELAASTLEEALLALRQGKYDPRRARFLTYLFGYARITLLRSVPSGPRETPLSQLDREDLEREAAGGSSAEESLARLEEMEAMRDCLRSEGERYSLSPEERALVLRRADGATYEVLARELDRARSAVFDAFQKALAKLRTCMAAKGFDGSPRD
ncbi:MAG: sigma-70 family RNA polymerase sigma factor [Planctomycetes bacterium]|nr:sigma-70 family RNA polymerase sigma factor [Planctomycetota bacterium]